MAETNEKPSKKCKNYQGLSLAPQLRGLEIWILHFLHFFEGFLHFFTFFYIFLHFFEGFLMVSAKTADSTMKINSFGVKVQTAQ